MGLFSIHHQQNIHVMNSYYANPAKANKDVMSPSFEASFFKSPLAFSWWYPRID